MKLKAIIIDDEPFGRDDLRDMLAAHKDIEIVGQELAAVASSLTEKESKAYSPYISVMSLRN